MLLFFLIFSILFLAVIIGYLIGYIRGRAHQQVWDDETQHYVFVAGWQNGFLYKLDVSDQQYLDKVTPKATEHFLAWKGYPHSRKH